VKGSPRMASMMLAELAEASELVFAACGDLVGRAPWPAADPLVGLL
jgi:hypothetical protein